ncbi:MAG: hypothetical protein DYG89_48645 [Caldilinea sp. CFX5]|nr:hypothetical protein [Caldilinea sp. CFX5]
MTNSKLLQPWRLPMQQWTVNLKRPAAGLVSGGLWGLLILGGGSRVAMRLVALIMGIPPSATATGTLGLLLMGAFVGSVIGVLYALLARWLPWHWRTNALLLSIMLAAVAVQPFVGARTGEAALAPSWIGAPLFVALPLLFCPLLAYTVHRLTPSIAARPRPVGLLWLLVFLALVGFVFVNLFALSNNVRIPQLVSRLVGSSGIAFHAMREFLVLWGALVIFCFCGLHLLLFWLAVDQPVVKLIGLGQLLLAAIFFRSEPFFTFLARGQSGSWGEWVVWWGLALCVVGALLWSWRQPARLAICLALVSFGMVFLLLWLLILVTPAMQLRGWTGVQAAVAVAPYLTIWLLLPVGLSWVAWRRV